MEWKDRRTKKDTNIDEWMEDVVSKIIDEGKLASLLLTESGEQITQGYPRIKLQKIIKQELAKRK